MVNCVTRVEYFSIVLIVFSASIQKREKIHLFRGFIRLNILLLGLVPQGHHGEVWCVAISPSGDHVVSSSHDKSLRLWERTREPIILEEEKEMVSV